MELKERIYYSRQYRRIKYDKAGIMIYLLLFVLPMLVLVVKLIPITSRVMANLAVRVLGDYFPGSSMQIISGKIGLVGEVEYIEMASVYPDFELIVLNILLALSLLVFFNTGRRKGNITSIYLAVGFSSHLINSIYFLFADNYFPYTAFGYSDLYIKQQVGVWVVFLVLAGLTTAYYTQISVLYRAGTVFAIMAYSVVFGIVRYILFLYILQKYSLLYMAAMFFVFGPFFDFLYFVSIYSLFINKVIKIYHSNQSEVEWLWS